MFRTYFTKDTTIIKNAYINTANNPITELFYGADKSNSKYLFKFDAESIRTYLNNGGVQATQNIKHYLKIYNSGFFDANKEERQVNDRFRASAVDVVLFKIPSGQTWNEGNGYDFRYADIELSLNSTYVSEPTNWFERTTLMKWGEEGIYSGATSTNYLPITTFNLDKGNENLIIDITDEVNQILSGTTWNEGFGLSFIPELEDTNTINNYTTAFFTSKTNTFFEPFIETVYDQDIIDSRNEFFLGKTNKLYLYTNINQTLTDLDNLPTNVKILDENGDLFMNVTGVTKESIGIYSITLQVPITYSKNVIFTDVWQGLSYNGTSISDKSLEFTLKPSEEYFNVGTQIYEPMDYKLNFHGIDRAEVILDNEQRKVVIEAKPFYNTKELIPIDSLYYRVYVRQGRNQIDIIPKTKIFRTPTQNYFILDTSWMKEHEYYLEISITSNGITKNIDNINFFVKEVGFNS